MRFASPENLDLIVKKSSDGELVVSLHTPNYGTYLESK